VPCPSGRRQASVAARCTARPPPVLRTPAFPPPRVPLAVVAATLLSAAGAAGRLHAALLLQILVLSQAACLLLWQCVGAGAGGWSLRPAALYTLG
jgi:hypothetical protein